MNVAFSHSLKAEDMDSDSSITYRLLKGDLDKFTIHPETGVIRTLRGLDYERRKDYTLIIGESLIPQDSAKHLLEVF